MKIRHYSKGEEQRLIELYKNNTAKEISKILNRTPESIVTKACKLGLTGNKYTHFSEDEKKYILENYSKERTLIIAKKLNRPIKPIYEFAYKNKLKKGRRIEWTKEQCETCGEIFDIPKAWAKRRGNLHCNRECKRLSQIGENSPNWKGGVSPYSFKFNRKLKRQIKGRDNYTCQKCGSREDLNVHHIDYNKINCEPENLITLCGSCNSRVNFQRGFWMGYFIRALQVREG